MTDFNRALQNTISHEGGYVNDPRDPGGETKFGISKRSYPNVDIAGLSFDAAAEIYYKDFWIKNKYDMLTSQLIAEQAFDLCVNCGAVTANKILQRAANVLSDCLDGSFDQATTLFVDGVLGSASIELLNKLGKDSGTEHLLLMIIERLAAEYYNKLKKKDYITGWLNRLFV